jgi:predicted amidophosphoribosyltransferase
VTRAALAWTAWLFDLILPRRCVSCGAPADLLCTPCFRQLRVLRPPWCALCGAPAAWPVARCRECSGRRLSFVSARAAVAYDGPVKAFVRGWKERGLRHATALAAELVDAHVERPVADVISYIPPDRDRQLKRGAHPAERLAAELASRWGLEAAPLLARARPVARQTGQRLVERRRSQAGAFAATTAVSGIVVDVYTSGSTTAAAASALRAAGASSVHVVTFARAIR